MSGFDFEKSSVLTMKSLFLFYLSIIYISIYLSISFFLSLSLSLSISLLLSICLFIYLSIYGGMHQLSCFAAINRWLIDVVITYLCHQLLHDLQDVPSYYCHGITVLISIKLEYSFVYNWGIERGRGTGRGRRRSKGREMGNNRKGIGN